MFTEEDATLLAKMTLDKVSKSIKDDLMESFYQEVEEYLYQHYSTVKNRIEDELISEISDNFTQDPSKYKFTKLRKRIFEEYKDIISSALTDDVIKERLEEAFLGYTNKDYWFSWQWKDGIVNVILKYWDDFEKDERVNAKVCQEIKRRDGYINYLKQRIEDAGIEL